MLALTLAGLLVLAAAWTMVSDSSTLSLLVYCAAGLAVACRLLYFLLRQDRVRSSLLVSATLVLLPVAWYFGNVLVLDLPAASRRHGAEILGAVLPGLVVGAATALSVAQRLSFESGPGAHARQQWHSRLLVLNALIVVGVAWFLFANTADNILLVSASLLAGAENYQGLGDMLIINLAVVWIFATPLRQRPASETTTVAAAYWALSVLVAASLACALFAGSNKLMLVALAFAVGLALQALRRLSPSRRLLVAVSSFTLLALSAWAVALLAAEGPADLLALTRLLDYGNVGSIWDTPSIASRIEILEDCAARQLALSPLTGDLAAEFRTCGDGHYLHSLLSIQTHLGLIGSLLFGAPLVRAIWLIAKHPAYRPLAAVVAVLLVTGLLAAHFTWTPFWFVLGLAAGLYRPDARRSSAQTWPSSSHGPALRA